MNKIFKVGVAAIAISALAVVGSAPANAITLNGPDSLDFVAEVTGMEDVCDGYYDSIPYHRSYAKGFARGWNRDYQSLNDVLEENGYDITLSRVTTTQVVRWLKTSC